LADSRLGYVHPVNRTPAIAVIGIGLFTAVCMFAGESILVPIAEVGSLASALGWMAACASYLRMRPSSFGRTAAATGIVVTLLILAMKILPAVPGHFSRYEWAALALWILLGLLLHRKAKPEEAAIIQEPA
jgi:accessory gene regulator protein AgrB